MFKEHLIFIHVPIASASISSPIVDQHLVATIDDEPIEDVDPVALDVDLVALDVVMDMPLRKSKRERGPQFQMTTLSTYKSMSMMWVMYHIQLSTKMPLLALNPIFWIDAMKDEMTSVTPRFPVRPDWRIRIEFEARDYILGLFTGFFFIFFIFYNRIKISNIYTKELLPEWCPSKSIHIY